ncbi:MAG: type II toxin-antitoxin system HicA family toxin [Thaumarchaeota archaeon]|nr:type II toxin-antitoxin system HicA family toxin [Nitrososphaerota archaeon]
MSRRRKQLHPTMARDLLKALSHLGFAARQAKGSHVFLKHPTVAPLLSRYIHTKRSIGCFFGRSRPM